MIVGGCTRPRHSPNPTRGKPSWMQVPRSTTSSPSSRYPSLERSPPLPASEIVSGSLPPLVISSRQPYSDGRGPLMVPVPRRSPEYIHTVLSPKGEDLVVYPYLGLQCTPISPVLDFTRLPRVNPRYQSGIYIPEFAIRQVRLPCCELCVPASSSPHPTSCFQVVEPSIALTRPQVAAAQCVVGYHLPECPVPAVMPRWLSSIIIDHER